MLTKLAISNYALINNLEVEFHAGLNTVTGETGAGKSIILGALGLILGNRADLSVLKNQNQKCIVEGTFLIRNYNLLSFFRENDLDYDDITILRREITPSGKSRVFINDTPVNLKILHDLGLQLIDIHSQHQNLELSGRNFQLSLVDTVAGTGQLLIDYREKYDLFLSLERKLKELTEKSEQEQTELDYWQFQFNQLEEAGLTEDEQEELEKELEQLTHAEEIKSTLTEVRHLLDDEHFSIIQNLKECQKKLEEIKNFLPEEPSLPFRVQSSLLELKDILDDVEQRAEGIEHNPERIEMVNDRLNLIFSLQQKHHINSITELIEVKNALNKKIEQVSGYDEEIRLTKNRLDECHHDLDKQADNLTITREKAFVQIENKVLTDLRQLGMPKAKLEILNEKQTFFTPKGKDSISLLFSANTDTPPTEISKIASGGETSRLMLAIKNLLRTSKALPTVIFDEIDSGISGEIALKMGNILKAFSASAQIINITHLPQIAAKGDAHFMVFKYEENGKTFTSVRQLDEKERVKELAKMVGGENLTDTTLKTAKELLKI